MFFQAQIKQILLNFIIFVINNKAHFNSMMKIKLKLLFLLMPLLAISCRLPGCTVVCGMKEFVFLDEEGNDLFNENTPGHLSIDDIRAYTPEGDSLAVVHISYQGINYFDIGINGNPSQDGITYLELGSITTDTIYARYQKKGSSIFISELYYNNVLLERNHDWGDCSTSEVIKIVVKPD